MNLWVEYARFPLTLFAILTPLAAIPVYVSVTNGQNRSVKVRVTRVTVLTVFVVLASAALGGDMMLRLFGSSLDALRGWGDRPPAHWLVEAVRGDRRRPRPSRGG